MATAHIGTDAPGRGAHDWALLFGGWTAFGLVQALMNTLPRGVSDATLLSLALFYLPLAWFWAAATPLVGRLDAWFARRARGTAARVLWHLPAFVLAAALHTAFRRWLLAELGSPPAIPFGVTFLYYADLTAAAYIGALWASHAIRARAELAAQHRITLRLQAELSAARLEYLEMQLRPHFLFNTLSTVAELGHAAPERAARMLRDVASLLRAAVSRSHSGVVSLGDELGALRSYLSIQRTRFADWLLIEESIAPDAHAALLPQFILQPLVENAVQHGLARRTAQGRITIEARVDAGRLRVSVRDNGIGLAAGASNERGLGLRNVRARLAALYGDDGRLTLEPDPRGGATATVDIPCRVRRGPTLVSDDAPTAPGQQPATTDASFWQGAAIRWATSHPITAIVLAWLLVGIVRLQHSYVYLSYRSRLSSETFASALRFDAAVAAIWMVLTPAVFWCARRFPFRREALALPLAAHAVLAFAFSLTHAAATQVLGGGNSQTLWSTSSAEVYAWNVAVYAVLVAVVHLRALDGWIRERALEAAQLQLELQDARFQKVMLELRPRVLLDAFEHLAAAIQRSPEVAERALADIGAFLRHTLDHVFEPVVPLRAEVEHLRAYGKVLGIATAPGLELRLTVPAELLDDDVPNGVLRASVDTVLAERPVAGAVVQASVDRGAAGITVSATCDARTHTITLARHTA